MTALGHHAGDPVRRPVRIPFPVVDEVARHCLQEEEPETVLIEVHLPGSLDPSRLRKAFAEALHRHPRILMHQARLPWYARRYAWELTGDPEVEAVTFSPPGPDALREARARALSQAPPLALSPPIRLEVVPGPFAGDGTHGTVLVLTVHHTALDGPACLRILATAAELYGGRDHSPAAPPVRPPEAPDRPANTPSPWVRPARVAPGNPETSPGNGLLVTELPVPHRPKAAPYTVNDQLMVATALTVARWNEEHGARPRPMRITMPVDDRPRDATMPIGNGTRLVEVPFSAEELTDGDLPALLRRTARRTRALKSLPRPQLGHGAALLTAPVVPVVWRAAAVRALRRAAVPWTSTTLLSNVGRIPYPMDFGAEAGRAHAVWFSAPARMPRGLTFTTASTDGRLHLALRWSRALLGPDDGARLRDLFEHSLHATEETP
ncbi:condensation protein [Streptomyces glomeratus]|uniref:Condensation protein n=1 Tax=Streptomyces glomeratus TaxID=284452 RepID=A0ABP6M508_9ACTN|nr:condensation protein [Streptomyces glomeratus]MCF1506910.1 condensation protein [Streptomyces glomeratus]